MQRTLFTGVAAVVMLVVAPGPSGAAGVTRSAPFDYGVQCFERDASASVSPIGVGGPFGCTVVPDPAAYAGRLSTRNDTVNTRAGVVQQGLTRGGVANASAGAVWAASGLFATSGTGARLTASAIVDGFTQDTLLCLYVGWRGYEPQAWSCGKPSPTVVIDSTLPNTDYDIQVRLMTPHPNSVGISYPCPPSGLATCTGGTTWTATQQSGITVREISYSFG